MEKSINNETISKNQIQSKTFFSNKDLKKETEKLPQIKNKILTKAKTLSLLTSKPQINKEISPEKKNIIRKKIDFEKQAQKFNSINLNDEEKSDNFIYESIKVNSIDNTTEKYDDGSLETVQSVDYPSMMLQSKSSDNKEISDVKVTFENEFLENNSRKKEVNLERIKLFKNSTLITYKNNEKIILERKDNHENKEFINEIDEMMNLNCRKDGEKYLFDPVLNCFYDQTTQTYYHKI